MSAHASVDAIPDPEIRIFRQAAPEPMSKPRPAAGKPKSTASTLTSEFKRKQDLAAQRRTEEYLREREKKRIAGRDKDYPNLHQDIKDVFSGGTQRTPAR